MFFDNGQYTPPMNIEIRWIEGLLLLDLISTSFGLYLSHNESIACDILNKTFLLIRSIDKHKNTFIEVSLSFDLIEDVGHENANYK